MTVPKWLADRLMVVSRADYVFVRDENPGLLRNSGVTVVPVPLLGAWIEFGELRGADLSPGEALVRDPDTGGYVSAEAALRSLSRRKARLLLQVCQHLGAKSVKIHEREDHDDLTALTNTFKAAASATVSAAASTDRGQEDRGLTATLTGNVRQQLRVAVESGGRWSGGEPDIESARKVIEGHDDAVDSELRTLIDMRAVRHNQVDNYQVTIDFYTEIHRHFTLFAEFAMKFEATFAKRSLVASAGLSNAFEYNKTASRHGKITFDVWFTDPD